MVRSRNRSDDQKQILTISLVLFVLLSLILGGTTYLGYADSADERKGRLEEKDKNKVMRRNLEEQTLMTSTYKALVGYDDKSDLKNIQGYKREHKDNWNAEIAKHGKTIPWNATEDLPGTTYSALIEKLTKEKMEAAKGRVTCEEQSAKARADFNKQRAELLKSNEDLKQALKDSSAKVQENFENIDKKYKMAIETLTAALPDNEAKTKEIETLKKDRDKAKDELARAQKDIETKIRKLEEKIPQVDLLAFDKPKGKILELDRVGNTVFLDLGSADYVKPGMTFSVFGLGEYKPTAERKASVEVVSVSGDHMCMARVTEIKSATRDPILKGDLLYNPAWTPGLREHVAIAGFIDLSGDGRDETAEFVKSLEKQGVIVDAYLDLKEMALKGALKKLDRQTGYLILGELPDLDKGGVMNQADPRLERKMNIHEEINKLHEQAKALGITIVPARKFMALVGMKVPKPSGPTDWTNYTLKPGAGVGGGEKKEEMKKEEMKKEEKKEEKKD
ncbi:MAG: hypothetical protein K2R98_06085 [Gemmataceae bacterium]|nr:hypothetical protein [Gemmataceae bacterium]